MNSDPKLSQTSSTPTPEKFADRWFTLKEMAEYLNCGTPKLYTLAKRGQIPAYKFGRRWRFKKEEVDAWLRQGEKRMNTTDIGKFF